MAAPTYLTFESVATTCQLKILSLKTNNMKRSVIAVPPVCVNINLLFVCFYKYMYICILHVHVYMPQGESEACPYCIGHCDDRQCGVPWEFPERCLTQEGWCPQIAPWDCIMHMCSDHCKSLECHRHRFPPNRPKSTNKRRGCAHHWSIGI